MPLARYMATDVLRLVWLVPVLPILVVGLRFSSPKPQLQPDEQLGTNVGVAHKAWAVRQLGARDILSDDGSTGRRYRRHLGPSSSNNSSVSECILLFGAFCNGEGCCRWFLCIDDMPYACNTTE